MSRKIYITETDKQKLQKMIDDAILNDIKNKEYMKSLNAELNRAEVVSAEQLPQGVITMNARILLLLDGFEEEISLVYPHEASVSNNMISVLSPVGTAILGYSEGDLIEWKVPSGVIKVEVKKVIHQHEVVV